jgi:hypothetical protein
MKGLAVAVFSVVVSSVLPASAFEHGGYGGSHGSQGANPLGAHSPRVHNPMWRHPVRVGRIAHHPHFRFRGHTFIFIGAPVYAAPWTYYPYVWDAEWGPTYYVPGQPGFFLYYCPDPAGYYPDVANCPAGWWPVVPNEEDGAED